MRSHWFWLAELSFPCPLAVIFNVSTCIQAREHDSNLCNGHRHDVPSRRCCREHRRSSRVITAGSRWQCSGLRCGRSSDSIAEETDSSPDPEEERQQHSCSSLLSISLTSEFAHTTSLSQSSLFFFGAKSYQEKGISRGLIDRSTHAWGFDASNPSWVKHRRMHRCVVATPPPPFLFLPLPPTLSNHSCVLVWWPLKYALGCNTQRVYKAVSSFQFSNFTLGSVSDS